MFRLHRLFSNMLVKCCIAVPISRIADALLQRSGWKEEKGYCMVIRGISALVFSSFGPSACVRFEMTNLSHGLLSESENCEQTRYSTSSTSKGACAH
jgi:hypothetical protein